MGAAQSTVSGSLLHTLFAVLLGVWLAGTLLEWFIATQNFATVDRVLSADHEVLIEQSRPLTRDRLRVLYRHLASELNRFYFRAWGWAQMVLAIALFALLAGMRTQDRLTWMLIGFMLICLGALQFLITPRMVALGRTLDFLPRGIAFPHPYPMPPEMGRYWRLHAAFTGLDTVKLILGMVVLVRWIRR